MSAPIYQIISTDGKQDQLITATATLAKRIATIKMRNILEGKTYEDGSPYPITLQEIYETHWLFVNASFKPNIIVGHQYIKSGIDQGQMAFGSTVKFKIEQNGNFYSDMVMNIRTSPVGDQTADPYTANRYRYVDLPGVKICKLTKFISDDTTLDEYNEDDIILRHYFELPDQKKSAWLRMHGQDVGRVGKTYHPDAQVNEERLVFDGAQTYKSYQPGLDLWIPLRFWFCNDQASAINSQAVKSGKTFVEVQLETLSGMFAAIDFSDNPINLPAVDITECSLYVNNIWIPVDISDLFIQKITFQIMRMHKSFRRQVNVESGIIRLDKLRHPTETIYMGIRPLANKIDLTYWYKLSQLVSRSVRNPMLVQNPNPVLPDIFIQSPIEYVEEYPVADLVTLKMQGLTLFEDFPVNLFNLNYPFRKESQDRNPGLISTTKDAGPMMINFGIYAGIKQTSGYFNLSRARELEFGWRESSINLNNPAELVFSTNCINFIMIMDGSMKIRYAT